MKNLFLVALLGAGLAACVTDDPRGDGSSETQSRTAPPPSPPPKETPKWRTINLTSEFGEIASKAAVSEWAIPLRQMDFPYQDVRARIFVECDAVWFRFDDDPNLTDSEVGDGYSTHRVRYRLDGGDEIRTWRGNQRWGGTDINLRDSASAVAAISRGDRLDVVFNWYGEGNVVFQWELSGSTKAIKDSCGA